MKKIIILLSLMAALFLNGCTVYNTIKDERSLGTIVDDTKIKTTVLNRIRKDKQVKVFDFNVTSFRGEVFIIGKYKSQAHADRAVEIAEGVQGVRSVTKYFVPKSEKDLCGTTVHVEMAGKIQAKLVKDKNISSTNVKFSMMNCKAVTWGILSSQEEIDRVLAHIGSVVGSDKVVNLLRVK